MPGKMKSSGIPPIGDVVASGNRAQERNWAEMDKMGVGPKPKPKPATPAKPAKVLSSSGTGYGSFKNK